MEIKDEKTKWSRDKKELVARNICGLLIDMFFIPFGFLKMPSDIKKIKMYTELGEDEGKIAAFMNVFDRASWRL